MKTPRTLSPDHTEVRLWLSRALMLSLRLEAVKLQCTLSELVERKLTEGGNPDARA